MKKFLLRLLNFPTCLLRMCRNTEMVGFFIPTLKSGCYRTRCPYCGKEYVRNTEDPFGGTLMLDRGWKKRWLEIREDLGDVG